ncbi:hypothetical protein CJ213_00850 [Gardnerella swidsinskii]|uniref:Uncharacterized protein n=1 Tax=Gardnerella swidsinskii TaxID=2792979 RepID=A0A9X7FEI8_9BIFI|nr:hypothetical protein CJ213_00850 [Gardnerella swidsinskii]RIY26048.1 hypothetical protein CJI51_05445 [Bifidobacteriaceae bacterium WP021]
MSKSKPTDTNGRVHGAYLRIRVDNKKRAIIQRGNTHAQNGHAKSDYIRCSILKIGILVVIKATKTPIIFKKLFTHKA